MINVLRGRPVGGSTPAVDDALVETLLENPEEVDDDSGVCAVVLLRSVVTEVVLRNVDDVRPEAKMSIDVVTGKLSTCCVEAAA